ncbi:MAG: DUF5309 family protein [Phycisphaerales bacterium]|nr:DUF5309 family protein [Phycisphaerales bacterium]
MLTVPTFTGPLDRNVTEEIILVQAAEDAPIYAALVGQGLTDETGNQKVEWYTDQHSVRTTAIDNGSTPYDETDTTLVVDSSAPFFEGCLIRADATGEIMYCVSVTNGTTIVVRRGVGGVVAAAAASVANNAVLRNLGPAAGEGRTMYAHRASNPAAEYNFLQTFRKTVEMSGRMLNEATLTENEQARLRKVKFEELIRDFEHALVFGARDNDTTDVNGKVVTTMGGLWQHITTNVDNVGGTMTKARMVSGLEPFFQFGSMEKWAFCGQLWLQTANSLFDSQLRLAQSDRVAGLQIQQLMLPSGGKLNLVLDRTLSAPLTGAAIVVDMAQAELVFARGERGRPRLKPIALTDGADAQAEEWFAEFTLRWGSEKFHGIQKGVTGAA